MAAPSLNVYKKVAVIRHPSDSLTYEVMADGVAAGAGAGAGELGSKKSVKSVSIQELGDAIATATPLHTPKLKLDIPVPRINKVESYDRDVPANFKEPISYIRYHRFSPEEWNKTLEYVADLEDETWLARNSMFGSNNSSNSKPEDSSSERRSTTTNQQQPRLPLRLFERMLDLLEKATGFEAIITTHQAETIFKAKIPQLYYIFPSSKTVRTVINEVYNYWVQKRSILNRPLLRRFWPVTSTDDTNPHLVFRPREKEKYKLRKKRQNDANAFRKMKQLRDDFDNLRVVLDLVRQREEIYRAHVKLQVELFEQRLYDIVDTSGLSRVSKTLGKDEVQRALNVPDYFDVHYGGRKAKRARKVNDFQPSPLTGLPSLSDMKRDSRSGGPLASAALNHNVAGRNHGEPAPNFMHPLVTRESYATSYEGTVPHVATYVNSHAQPTHRFRHRPRVGRGGRLCIDRLPQEPLEGGVEPPTVYTAGRALPRSLEPKERLLELLPPPLDYATASRRIEAIALSSIKEDYDTKAHGDTEENDGSAVIVRLDDWLETDDQLWGDERYSLGPI